MKFNINDYVKVKLTDKGKDIFYHRDDLINEIYGKELIKPHMPKVDENGYTKFQLHDLMKIFGKHLINGLDIPFETEIIIDKKDLKHE